jgi:hypothetical protein
MRIIALWLCATSSVFAVPSQATARQICEANTLGIHRIEKIGIQGRAFMA